MAQVTLWVNKLPVSGGIHTEAGKWSHCKNSDMEGEVRFNDPPSSFTKLKNCDSLRFDFLSVRVHRYPLSFEMHMNSSLGRQDIPASFSSSSWLFDHSAKLGSQMWRGEPRGPDVWSDRDTESPVWIAGLSLSLSVLPCGRTLPALAPASALADSRTIHLT